MLFFSDFLWTQVRIKESIIIKPTVPDSLKRNYGINSDQLVTETARYESLFLECGGSVTLKALENVGTIILLPSMQVIAETPVIGQIYPVGTFSADSYLKFGIRNDEPPHIVLKNNYGAMGVDNWYEIGLLVYVENNNRYYQIANLNFNVGDSCTCLDLRSANGPPREPQPIIAPAETHLVVDFWNMKGRDSLYFYKQNELLRDTLFLDSTLLRRAPVIDLGSVQMGDTMNFFLKSMVKFTKGEIMYPKSVFYGDSWGIGFENWIDNHFGDYAASLYMAPTRYKIQFDKEKVLPGDTVRFQIEVIGTPSQNIESELDVNILKGRHHAVIVDTTGFLYGTDLSGSNRSYQPFAQIKNNLALVISNTTPIGEKVIIQVASTWSSIYSGRAEIEVQNQHTILLGESKYYQAKEINSELKIFEYSTPQVGNLTNVTFIVDTVNCAGAGKRLGVYYEKKKPDGTALPTDQIRLIGRYWHQDSTYKVRLVASKDGKTDTIIIDVIKPNRLGNTNANKIDVFNKQYNLDSLIIYYAGLNGIPPQLIKGQIEEESSFRPSYNYEPFTDAIEVQGKKWLSKMSNNPFWINNTGSGLNTIPSNHIYLWRIGSRIQYPNQVQTIWDYYNSHRGYYPKDLYTKIKQVWKDSLFKIIKDSLIKNGISQSIADQQAFILANDSLPGYLRDHFEGGLKNKIAQTRISASYGLLQLVYFYGITNTTENQYPENLNHLPEKINEVDTSLTYSIKHLKSLFYRKEIKTNFTASSGWNKGYDGTFKDVLSYYNKRVKYILNVLSYSNKYLPTR